MVKSSCCTPQNPGHGPDTQETDMSRHAEFVEALKENEEREQIALQLTIAAAALMPPVTNMDQAVSTALELFAKMSKKLGLS